MFQEERERWVWNMFITFTMAYRYCISPSLPCPKGNCSFVTVHMSHIKNILWSSEDWITFHFNTVISPCCLIIPTEWCKSAWSMLKKPQNFRRRDLSTNCNGFWKLKVAEAGSERLRRAVSCVSKPLRGFKCQSPDVPQCKTHRVFGFGAAFVSTCRHTDKDLI